MIEKKWFTNCRKTKEYLLSTLDLSPSLYDKKNDDTSEMDEFILPLLKATIGDDDFSNVQHGLLFNKLPKIHKSKWVVSVVKKRWEAVLYHFQDKNDACIESLKSAYDIASGNKSVPDWLSNNILIDIRNQAGVDYETMMDAQSQIEKSSAALYFPLLDRFNGNAYSKLVSNYEKTETILSNTIELVSSGYIQDVIEFALKEFLVAAYYGSITHMCLINSILKKLLFSVNLKYANSKYFCNYIKACAFHWEGQNDENSLSKTFVERFNLVSHDETKALWESTFRVPKLKSRLTAQLIILRFLGNYMDDKTFRKATSECIELSENEGVLLSSSGLVEKFLRENAYRMNANKVIDFVFKKSKTNINFICSIYLNSLFNMDYSNISQKAFNTLKQIFMNHESVKSNPLSLRILMIAVRKGVEESKHKELDELIKKHHSDFYYTQYSFELHRDAESEESFIKKELQISKNVNERQGKAGATRYGYEPLITVKNILTLSKNILSTDVIADVVSEIKDTLDHPGHPMQTKVTTAQLLLLLLQKYDTDLVKKCSAEYFAKHDQLVGRDDFFDTYSKATLDVVFAFIGCLLGKICKKDLIFLLSLISGLKTSEQIEISSIIHRFTSQLSEDSLNADLLMVLFQFVLSSTYSASNVIRHYSIRTLTFLTSYLDGYADDIVSRFAEMYTFETVSNKSYLMDGAWKINRSNPLTVEIFESAKKDSNYHIRRLESKLRAEI